MATKKSFSKEQWEAMTGTEMSQFLPDGENLESTEESFTGDVGIENSINRHGTIRNPIRQSSNADGER